MRSSRACRRPPNRRRSICSSNVIREIEVETFEEPALVALARRLKGDASTPAASRGIARLARISDWADSRHNVFLRLSEIPLLFTLQLAYAAESWRRRTDRDCATGWMRSAKWKRCCRSPDTRTSIRRIRFPELLEGHGAGVRGHGGRPSAAAGGGDQQLVGVESRPQVPSPQDPQVLIVSGSNMSGKSTLMRTVGHQRACWRSPARRFAPRSCV